MARLKKFIPDMSKFVAYLFDEKQVTRSFLNARKSVTGWFVSLKIKPSLLISFILYLLILFLMYLLLKLYLPELAIFVSRIAKSGMGIPYVVSDSWCLYNFYNTAFERSLWLVGIAYSFARPG